MPDDLATLAEEINDEMLGRKTKAPELPETPEPPPYWNEVEHTVLVGAHRRRFEHALPDGGMVVLVRHSDPQSESCSVCYVPPMPRPSAYGPLR